MIAPLDVFSVKDGHPKWLGCAETLPKALMLAARESEGLYFVFPTQREINSSTRSGQTG